MKSLFLALTLIFPFISHAGSMIRGINYDPVHSVIFAHGVGTDNKQLMEQAILNDLDKLKNLEHEKNFKITHLKTFFTVYSSLNNTATVNMADVVNQWNQANPDDALTLALGVYEFRQRIDACSTEKECQSWTQAQIDGVKQALEQYNGNNIPLIDKVIIGNENLTTNGMPIRLVNDINQMKNFLHSRNINNVSIGTAQTVPDVIDMYKGKDYQNVLNAADFIGINIYPFWSKVPYGEQAKAAFAKTWIDLKKLKNWGKKPIIETEEGWPSDGDNASIKSEYDYFYYWLYGHASKGEKPKPNEDYLVQSSYYFALNDKLPGQGIESHWGLFSADNATNIFDNLETGKTFASSIVFPTFTNHIGADKEGIVYSLKNLHKVIITACAEDNGKGACYPLYGFQGSGLIDELKVDSHSWDNSLNGFTRYSPGETNQYMIDTSTNYYKSLYIILDDQKNYPGVCWVNLNDLASLSNYSLIKIEWPEQGLPQPCLIY